MQGWQNTKHRPAADTTLSPNQQVVANSCLYLVDAGLCGILFVAPLVFGGRHDLGRFVFVLLCATVSIAWFCRQAVLDEGVWRRTLALGVFTAAVVVVGMQLLPLSTEWLETLAPRTGSLLPLWHSGSEGSVGWGPWRTLSLAPDATRQALAMLLAYGLLFLTTVGRLKEIDDVERLLRGIGLAALVMASFGLVQYFTSNGLFLWFYEHPYRTADQFVSGSFANRNHFAHFLTLGIGPLIAWVLSRQADQRNASPSRNRFERRAYSRTTVFLALALATVVFAVLHSLSRGATIALVSALIGATVVYSRGKVMTSRTVYGTIAMSVVLLGMLSIHGYELVSARLDSLASGSIEQIDPSQGRRSIWKANVAAIGAGWPTGSGAGTHREIYPVYLRESFLTEFTHAENGYLQIVTENGLPGALLLASALVLVACWCFRAVLRARSSRETLCAGAVVASLTASVVHALVDFVWFIPACMSLTILLAACALRLAQIASASSRASCSSLQLPRLWWIGSATVVLLAGLWAVSVFAGPALASIHWDRYLIASRTNREVDSQLLAAAPEQQAELESSQQMLHRAMISHLQLVLHWHPGFARAHQRLADRYLEQFALLQRSADNAMPASQIREAAMSNFSSPEALRQWLNRAIGAPSKLLYQAHFHARQAAQLAPLQGKSYLTLATLCFLDGQQQAGVQAYVEQGLRVRPYDGKVLFEAGRQYLLLGQPQQAFQLWAQAFQDRGSHQRTIIDILSGKLNPSSQVSAVQLVELLQPTWDTLPLIWQRYQELGESDDLEVLINYAAQVAAEQVDSLPPNRRTHIWVQLAAMQLDQQQTDLALKNLRRAFDAAPGNFQVRYALARCLLEAGLYQQADPHLRWCLSRRPGNQYFQNALVMVAKQRVSLTSNDDELKPTNPESVVR